MSADRPRVLVAHRVAASLFGAWGISVAVPLLLALGPTESFFTAHRAGRIDIVLFTAATAIGPPLVLTALIVGIGRFAPRIARGALHAVVGALVAFAFVPAFEVLGQVLWVAAAAIVVVAVAVAALHARRATVRTFLRWAAIGPAVVVAWFLLVSSVAGLVLPATAVGQARAKRDTNVLYVIFDELPLAALLDRDGALNARRFPHMSDLARQATWYPSITTVSRWTFLAVPAMLSGRMPRSGATSSYYARNVFSMLEPTHELVPMELVTQLCRDETCGQPSDIAGLYDDAFIIYGHTKLPGSLASRWLPPIGDRWSNFREKRGDAPLLHREKSAQAETERLGSLIDEIEHADEGRPKAWVAHFRVPHLPLTYLPDGRRYESPRSPPGLARSLTWLEDDAAIDVARQRFLLQVRYVDRMIGQMVDALKRSNTFEETMIVLASDHGIAFRPGTRRALPTDTTGNADTLPVPLLIKYPGQREPMIDPRPGQVTDIAPTIADALDIDLPPDWSFDGRSLASEDAGVRRTFRYFDGKSTDSSSTAPDPMDGARRYLRLFGVHRDHDLFAWGPHRRLVGRRAPEAARPSGVTARIDAGAAGPSDEVVPAFIRIAFDESVRSSWIAVAVDGQIAGLGRVYGPDADLGMAMVDPSFYETASPRLGVFLISDDGDLRAVRVAGDQG